MCIFCVNIPCFKSLAAFFVVPQFFTIDFHPWGSDSFEIRQFQDNFPSLFFYRLCLFPAQFGSAHIYLHISGIAGSCFVVELSAIAAGNTRASFGKRY
jgi:hypothetical protein